MRQDYHHSVMPWHHMDFIIANLFATNELLDCGLLCHTQWNKKIRRITGTRWAVSLLSCTYTFVYMYTHAHTHTRKQRNRKCTGTTWIRAAAALKKKMKNASPGFMLTAHRHHFLVTIMAVTSRLMFNLCSLQLAHPTRPRYWLNNSNFNYRKSGEVHGS